MKAKLSIASVVFIICVTLCCNLCFACPDIVGDWKLVGSRVLSADSGTNGTFDYQLFSQMIHIINQNGCLFYGYRGVGTAHPLTGSIREREVTFSDADMVYRGEILNRYPVTGQYRTISGTGSTWDFETGWNIIASVKMIRQ
jgi:hypothetical protein